MTLLIRFILISIIIYLLIRSFARFFEEKGASARKREHDRENSEKSKNVSKDVGEYVDYEEIE